MDPQPDSGDHPAGADAAGASRSGLSTSHRLLLRFRQGHRSAADLLFRRLLPSLTRFARGRLPPWARNRLDTGDLVQEAIAGILPRLHRLEPRRRRAVRHYLRTAIRNRVIDEVRRAGKVEVPASESLDAADRRASPLEVALKQERQDRLRQGLVRLQPSDQELLVGRLLLRYSYEQLALATGRPSTSSARVAVRRAVERLAREIPPE
jgi:RNA polymerase sigma-70 factor (ECF subfamily)